MALVLVFLAMLLSGSNMFWLYIILIRFAGFVRDPLPVVWIHVIWSNTSLLRIAGYYESRIHYLAISYTLLQNEKDIYPTGPFRHLCRPADTLQNTARITSGGITEKSIISSPVMRSLRGSPGPKLSGRAAPCVRQVGPDKKLLNQIADFPVVSPQGPGCPALLAFQGNPGVTHHSFG